MKKQFIELISVLEQSHPKEAMTDIKKEIGKKRKHQ